MTEEFLSPRMQAMKEVIANDLENKKVEGFDVEGMLSVVVEPPQRPENVSEEDWGQMSEEAKGEAARATEEPATETTTETATEEPPAIPPLEAVKTVKIKVDGQEIEVPESEIIAAGIKARQQETAADTRLEEAKRLLREAKEMKETLGTPVNQPAPSEVDFGSVAHAIQYGSKEEATEALKTLQAQGSLTNQQMASLVDERVAFQDAVNFYKTEFKEIANDPDWHKLFLLKEREARQAGNTKPYRELYAEIGTELKSKIASLTPKPVDQLAAKRALKANQSPQPVAAAARLPAPTEQKVPTPSEVVEAMRKKRHQA